MLNLKLQYFGHLMQRTESLEKTLMLGKIEGRLKAMTEDEMVGWPHWLDGFEFEQALGVGDGQGSVACCSPWGLKELDTTEQLNWILERCLDPLFLKWFFLIIIIIEMWEFFIFSRNKSFVHFMICKWGGAEFATPKYASLAYWLFWADSFGEAAGTEKNLWKQSGSCPFVRDIYIYKEKSPLVRVSPSLYQEEKND